MSAKQFFSGKPQVPSAVSPDPGAQAPPPTAPQPAPAAAAAPAAPPQAPAAAAPQPAPQQAVPPPSAPPEPQPQAPEPAVERQSMDVDIACVGFGPATGGFLTELTRAMQATPDDPAFQSRVAPGMPQQVICYERADDLGAGVSGVVTRGRAIRSCFPSLNPEDITMGAEVRKERVFYMLDPHKASNRSFLLRSADRLLNFFGPFVGVYNAAYELPWTPEFLHKDGGMILSLGQFNQWVASNLMSTGMVQIWPGMPVDRPLYNGAAVSGIRLADQGVDKNGKPEAGFMPGMDVRAQLTVVGDGPVGQVGHALDKKTGAAAKRNEWALGMKFVIELPPDPTNPLGIDQESLINDGVIQGGEGSSPLTPGTVWHTFGYPEPEIFGFLYVHPGRIVSVGIFVPSWMGDPHRTAYRYLQHYIQHPLLWQHLKNGTLRSWGAKSLEESGKRGEPLLAGNGFARIGEGSGSTNMLTGSGVDEAWATGTQLADAVVELLRANAPFTQENLNNTYVQRRRSSWVEQGAVEAKNARNGFHDGFVKGLIGMGLAGLTGGLLSVGANVPPASRQIRRSSATDLGVSPEKLAADAMAVGRPLHDLVMDARGWPAIEYDDKLLISHQDVLLKGGKVQAMPGYADHVVFLHKENCHRCEEKTCISMCSGQAITLGTDGFPAFEREKCIHCGGCLWNCANPPEGETSNVSFRAGSGGLHSVEN